LTFSFWGLGLKILDLKLAPVVVLVMDVFFHNQENQHCVAWLWPFAVGEDIQSVVPREDILFALMILVNAW